MGNNNKKIIEPIPSWSVSLTHSITGSLGVSIIIWCIACYFFPEKVNAILNGWDSSKEIVECMNEKYPWVGFFLNTEWKLSFNNFPYWNPHSVEIQLHKECALCYDNSHPFMWWSAEELGVCRSLWEQVRMVLSELNNNANRIEINKLNH